MKKKNVLVSIFMLVALLVCNMDIMYASDSTTGISKKEGEEKAQLINDEIYNLNGVQVSVDTIRVLYDVEINPNTFIFSSKIRDMQLFLEKTQN